jgi:hypothetical protein
MVKAFDQYYYYYYAIIGKLHLTTTPSGLIVVGMIPGTNTNEQPSCKFDYCFLYDLANLIISQVRVHFFILLCHPWRLTLILIANVENICMLSLYS